MMIRVQHVRAVVDTVPLVCYYDPPHGLDRTGNKAIVQRRTQHNPGGRAPFIIPTPRALQLFITGTHRTQQQREEKEHAAAQETLPLCCSPRAKWP